MSTINKSVQPNDDVSPAQQDPPAIDLERRRFLARVCYAAGGLIAAVIGLPAVGMYIAPMFERLPDTWRAVGTVDQFVVGSTTLVQFASLSPVPWSGQTGQTGAWLRRDSETEWTAFAINCTHLGCPVRWEAGAELFLCPCHGGAYYADGTVAAGPPPKALNRYMVRVNNGQVEIQASPLPITT